MNGPPRTIVLSANSDWDVANFRGGLIRGPRRAGYGPVVLAPQDPAADAAATAVVLPTYGEGLPRSLLEAAAMARPLTAADVPGCRDVVEAGIKGYLCNVRDAGSLASAMERMTTLPMAERLAMGEAARRKVQNRFNEDFVVKAYLDVLAGLDAAKPGIRC